MDGWYSVEELTRLGFARSPVVMANEAHNGMIRCVRTREVGVRMVQAAHQADQGAIVPTLWRLEVANSLSVAVRRGRIEPAFRDAALADLALLDITVDAHTDAQAWGETLRLADRFRLTSYDAAYLKLAKRRNLPIATLDRELAAAAMAVGIAVLGTDGHAP